MEINFTINLGIKDELEQKKIKKIIKNMKDTLESTIKKTQSEINYIEVNYEVL